MFSKTWREKLVVVAIKYVAQNESNNFRLSILNFSQFLLVQFQLAQVMYIQKSYFARFRNTLRHQSKSGVFLPKRADFPQVAPLLRARCGVCDARVSTMDRENKCELQKVTTKAKYRGGFVRHRHKQCVRFELARVPKLPPQTKRIFFRFQFLKNRADRCVTPLWQETFLYRCRFQIPVARLVQKLPPHSKLAANPIRPTATLHNQAQGEFSGVVFFP